MGRELLGDFPLPGRLVGVHCPRLISVSVIRYLDKKQPMGEGVHFSLQSAFVGKSQGGELEASVTTRVKSRAGSPA